MNVNHSRSDNLVLVVLENVWVLRLRSQVFVLQTFESWKLSLIIVEISSETLEEVHVRFLGPFSQEISKKLETWFDLHLISLLFWRYDWEIFFSFSFSFPFLLGNQDKIICNQAVNFVALIICSIRTYSWLIDWLEVRWMIVNIDI